MLYSQTEVFVIVLKAIAHFIYLFYSKSVADVFDFCSYLIVLCFEKSQSEVAI